jgi:diguanylate cyclase (GGDEF)-like protein
MPIAPDLATSAGRAIARLLLVGLGAALVVALASLAVQAAEATIADVAVLGLPPILVGSVIAIILVAIEVAVVRRVRRKVRILEDDLTGLREAYDRARLDSLRDGLTGLGNHRAFQEELDAQLAIARDSGQPLALLIVDVDDLKKINDRTGHAAGDALLRTLAQIMWANLRRGDRAHRIGGDEFAVLLPGCDLAGADVIAKHLLAAALSGNHGRGGAFSITVGVTAYPLPSSDRQQMIHHADAALYAGKRRGRTNVQTFDPTIHGVADDSRPLAEIEAAVQRVVNDGLLRAVYQPIFSLIDGRVIGYEGLVRLASDTDFPDPTSLFVAAEATRRTVELDVVCARTVLAGAAAALGADQYLSINLSPRTLESDAFSPLEILALARRHGISPTQLVVELTEREAVEDLGKLQSTVSTLRRHAVRIAIDDVGAGNAGLRLLSEVDFDIMKIDLSLVRAGATHEPTEAVLRALGTFARQRDRKIVAEGIETAELLEAVLELRYDAGQGYLFGRAQPHLAAPALDLFALLSEAQTEVVSAA